MSTLKNIFRCIGAGCCLAVAATLVSAPVYATEMVFHVTPEGNDAWSGKLDAPAPNGTDGPFATIVGARDALRALRQNKALTGSVRVWVHPGTYVINDALRFAPEDSGTKDAPIVYSAKQPGQTFVDGGRRITGWREENGLWVADIPEVKAGTWDFSALWVNGKRRHPARTPNPAHEAGDYPAKTDFFYADGPVMEKNAEGKKVKSNTRFHFHPEDVQQWSTLEDAIVVVFHSWATSLHRIKSVDLDQHILEFTGPARWPLCRWKDNQWFFIEHLFEALDQPGEWFLNRKEGKLFYLPFPDEDMQKAEVVAPVTKQMLILEGAPKEGHFVEHLSFEGITFQYAEQPIGPKGHSDGQAETSLTSAVECIGARHCRIENCLIQRVGGYGVWFRTGCQDSTLQHCEVTDLGGGGVRIGECASAATPEEACERILLDNCYLHDGGRVFRSAIGVWIGRSSYNTVRHCDVCDFRYSGFSVGWSWGYAESSAHHNIIEYNHIHDCGKGQLSDMGGIYTLGVSPGTVLRNNYIHDILSNPNVSGGWGLYTDEGSSEILMENNIVHHTRTGTFHQHYGRENILRNNILAFSEREQLIRSREEDHLSFTLDGNIIVMSNGQLLGSRWENGNYALDNNIYWDITGDTDLDFAGKTFEEWQQAGYDVHSEIADPLFVDIVGRDFTLQPDSPALQKGFKPIDIDTIGLYGDPQWVSKPKQIQRPTFVPPSPPEPVRLQDGFEENLSGTQAKSAATNGESGKARIRVSKRNPASGKRCLRFADAPGLDKSYNPHLVYTPHLRKGNAMARFAIRIDKNVEFYHEWRDAQSPYHVGPSIWFYGDGRVQVAGKEAGHIPVDTWCTVEINCTLGKAAKGTWSLEITTPNGQKQTWEDLPCDPKFRRLDWLGFVSNATVVTETNIDDLYIGPAK